MLTFKMSYGRAVPYISVFCLTLLLILSIKLLLVKVWLIGAGALLITVGLALFVYKVLHNPPVYVIDDTTISFKQFYRQDIYPIDRINRIQYIDLGVEYSRGPNNSRLQLAIYFDRSLFKSTEPRAFCPVDRDGFVEALLTRNPAIEVIREDIRPK